MDGICPGGRIHTIQAGDTFYRLSQIYSMPLDYIYLANPGIDANNLQVGQQVCIPPAITIGGCPLGTLPQTVAAGDTFFSLASRFGVSVSDIQAANPGVDPNSLTIGQTLCIPFRIS